jgi:hypothetical protein
MGSAVWYRAFGLWVMGCGFRNQPHTLLQFTVDDLDFEVFIPILTSLSTPRILWGVKPGGEYLTFKEEW